EVYPEVYYPLSWSTTAAESDTMFRDSMTESGAFTPADFEGDEGSIAGVYNGYAYLNLSVSRVMAIRLPGATVEDVDKSFLGISEAPPHQLEKGHRNLRASFNILRYVWRTLGIDGLPELETDKLRVKEWTARLPALDAPFDELKAFLQSRQGFIYALFRQHLTISGQSALALGVLETICRDQLDDASLALRLVSGLGDVESADPSQALWSLGRTVAQDPTLTAHFDQGLDGLADRLRADAAALDVAAFLAHFDHFLAEFGSRGPNEWEAACPTWGTDHSLPLALIDRMRCADPGREPALQISRLAAERSELTTQARADLNWLQRRIFDKALRSSQVLAAGRERSKTTIIKAIHELRLRSYELADRLAAEHGIDPGDIWFVLQSEIEDYVAEPGAFASTIAERRAMRDHLSELVPPFVFVGSIPPISEWERRPTAAARAEDQLAAGEQLVGISGAAGKTRGRACVVTDPGQPGDLGPGDVLVAPLTDPSWTPLFVPAEAVVVDVGAAMSHAVIVSRELGLPCVVSATDATRRIPHGAMIEVDGSSGTVTVIELP
ncbi:MAG: phosphoenolpyruvate-utilizing protein, partial [Acidimicrobiales bacterium]|nr:phosphoenolpyruvate-utilizing protein [Acidimicrobiales bacterium]